MIPTSAFPRKYIITIHLSNLLVLFQNIFDGREGAEIRNTLPDESFTLRGEYAKYHESTVMHLLIISRLVKIHVHDDLSIRMVKFKLNYKLYNL